MFTPLQELVLKHGEELANSLQNQVYALARKYEFATDMRNTPENDVMQTVRQLEQIFEALLKERK